MQRRNSASSITVGACESITGKEDDVFPGALPIVSCIHTTDFLVVIIGKKSISPIH